MCYNDEVFLSHKMVKLFHLSGVTGEEFIIRGEIVVGKHSIIFSGVPMPGLM